MTHEELLLTPEYWIAKIQIDLYNKVEKYIEEKGINRTILAQELGCSKGYITQLLNGDYDHRISKLVKLSLAIGCLPEISFRDLKGGVEYSNLLKKTMLDSSKETGSFFLKAKVEDINKNDTSNTPSTPPSTSLAA